MATETLHNELRVITIDPKEAADLIGLLAAQLAGKPLINNHAGAIASVNVVEHGVVKYRLCLMVDK